MDAMRTTAYTIVFCMLLGMASAGLAAVPAAPPVPAAAGIKSAEITSPAAEDAPAEPVRPAINDACRLKGVVVCSEYGARQKEDLWLILVDENGYRHDARIFKDDGTFYTRIPCSGTYEMRIEFGDGAIELGSVTLPVADDNATYDLRIVHPGSMLELILEARTSAPSDLTYRAPIAVPSR